MSQPIRLSRNFVPVYALTVALFVGLIGCTDSQESEMQDSNGGQTGEASGSQQDATQADQEGNQDETSMSDVKKEVGEAAQATKEYSAERMAELRTTLQEQFEQLDDDYESLQQYGQDLAGDARQQWEEQMAQLKDQRKEIQDDLQSLGEASGQAWQELRTGINNALDEFKSSVNSLADKQESNDGKQKSDSGSSGA